MFQLLSNVQSVPIDQDSIATVHRGMNKIRVSVGEHTSEPSEVYIITGQSNGNLESYIIFYMLEPGIHVVYGCDENPYALDRKEQVIEEAIVFVEEMGSILEEIPWKTMTPDQRNAWVEKEILYAAPVIVELERLEEPEELVELNEIEAVAYVQINDEEPEEGVLHEDPILEAVEDVVEISEDEVEQALKDNGSDESLSVSEEDDENSTDMDSEPEDIDEKDVGGIDSAGMEDVVIAEGDFDELLKQAFLNPDVAKKSKLTKGKREPVQVEEEQEMPEEPEAAVEEMVDWSSEELALGAVKTPAGPNDNFLSEKKIRIEVIRFLARF